MKDVHCDPAEALQIHRDIGSMKSLAIHWGTYPLAEEDFVEPAFDLAKARETMSVSSKDFFTMNQGDTYTLDDEIPTEDSDFATVQQPELYRQFLLLDQAGGQVPSTPLPAASRN